ncbi:intein-containing Rv2578c family radical SAM protein [Geodermatophilus sp. SYSU D00815]
MTGVRWDAQRLDPVDDGSLPGMPSIRGLLRSVQVPEFPGVTLHEVRSRSALNAVPAGSPMPFRWTVNPYRGCAHSCVYCTSGDTLVLMADGRRTRIADLRVGDRIIGTRVEGPHRRYVATEVLAHWSTVKPAFRITLEDGTGLVASGDHRFLSRRGWKHVVGAVDGPGRRPYLTTDDQLLGHGRTAEPMKVTDDYRRGYLTGIVRGEGSLTSSAHRRADGRPAPIHQFRLPLVDAEALDRSQDYLDQAGIPTDRFVLAPASGKRRATNGIRTQERRSVEEIRALVAWPAGPSEEWQRGFLAGIFDAEGCRSGGALRISTASTEILDAAQAALSALGFDAVLEDPGLPARVRTVRVRGGLREQLRFVHLVDPAIRRRCSIAGDALESDAALGVVEVRPLGVEIPMYDITTGTGDFVANGVISHNCFARKTHEWLELDPGRDFDTQIVVKTNLVEVLERELARPSWRREHVAMGTNTDPYQRAEGRYRLMPGVIRALARSGTPFSILTKGTLARRDVPLLAAASRDVPIGLGVSMAIWDDDLHRALEPGVPSPRARLELVRAVTDAGLPCGVFLAPVLPGLTDDEESLDAALAAIAAAGATGVTVLALHLRPGAREWFLAWLQREHPALVPHYRRLYGRGAYVPAEYRDRLARRVAPLLARHGLDRQRGGTARGVDGAPVRGLPGDEQGEFPAGSLPAAVDRPEPPEQLALC